MRKNWGGRYVNKSEEEHQRADKWRDGPKEGTDRFGEPIGEIERPRNMEDNTITAEMVDDSPPERPERLPEMVTKPHIGMLLGSGYNVAFLGLSRLEEQLKNGTAEMDSKTASIYHKLIDSFAKLAREERAQESADDVTQMSDEELAAFLAAEQAAGRLPSGDNE